MSAFWKSILGAIIAGLTSLVTASMDDPTTSVNEAVLTWPEILTAIIAVLVAFGAVATVPNAGFVNLNKLTTQPTLAPAVYEGFTGNDWTSATAMDRQSAQNAVHALVSTLRR